jgi:hypothetical protein
LGGLIYWRVLGLAENEFVDMEGDKLVVAV